MRTPNQDGLRPKKTTVDNLGSAQSAGAGAKKLLIDDYEVSHLIESAGYVWKEHYGLKFDVVVYGATPGGIAAAVRASENGASVLLVDANDRVGGMCSGGLSYTDVNKDQTRATVAGYADRIFKKLAKYYGITQQSFYNNSYNAEPRAFNTIFRQEINRSKVTYRPNSIIGRVSKTGTTITSAFFFGIGEVSSKVFIDATYEGDLLAMAGCSYSLGREANAAYGETLNGITGINTIANFPDGIDPYVTAGNPASGLLYGVWNQSMGTTGAADGAVMSPCYRLCVTSDSTLGVPFPSPDNYVAANYELFGRYAAVSGTAWASYTDVLLAYGLQDVRKYDVNQRNAIGLNFVMPECTEYVTASWARRKEIEYNCKQWILGLIKFLSTDSRIPLACRTSVSNLKLCNDEFISTAGFSSEMYVREGRRLIGDFVLSEGAVTAANAYTDPVAYMYYAIDSHMCRRVYVPGVGVKNEGQLHANPIAGNAIPWRVCLPKVAECTNLLATFAVSCSHVAFCSLRMEPIHMAIGGHCGSAAAIAAMQGITVQEVPYSSIKALENINGASAIIRNTKSPSYSGRIQGALIIDTSGAFNDGTRTETGTWGAGTATVGNLGSHKASSASGASQKFAPNIPVAGKYSVYLKYPDTTAMARSTVTPVTIVSASGTVNLTIDQNQTGDGGDWLYLGDYIFAKGSPSAHYVQIGTDGVNSSVISAVKFLPA